jgi:hypothetical protein
MTTFVLAPIDIEKEPIWFYLLRFSLISLFAVNVHRFVWVGTTKSERQRAALELGADVKLSEHGIAVRFPDAPDQDFIATYISNPIPSLAHKFLTWGNTGEATCAADELTQFDVAIDHRRIRAVVRSHKDNGGELIFEIEPYDRLGMPELASIFVKLKTMDRDNAYFYPRASKPDGD